MFSFLKNLLSKVNFKSDNAEVNKFNKIIYTAIILCAIIFIEFIIYFLIRIIPDFISNVQINWNESKSIFKRFIIDF